MTYSLVARDPDGRTVGVASASRYLAVGSTVPGVAAGVGALATQASTNVMYRERGLRALRAGEAPRRVVEALVGDDLDRDRRQLAVVSLDGPPAAWTGPDCVPWAGQVVRDDCAAVGNLLAGPQVLPAVLDAFEGTTGDLAHRLLAALAAGDAAGGDRRGRQSAALVVASGPGTVHLRTPARVDLRVDDHPDPVRELARLVRRHDLLVAEPDPASALPLTGETAAEVARALRLLDGEAAPDPVLVQAVRDARGVPRPVTGPELELRLAVWAVRRNLGHLTLPGAVDAALLAELRDAAPEPPG
ncbi:DUF1028 domain-containing protein [Cellulomonas endometrii]|uniref:DUF1028 domain-containing protein n=1 Tax=Cellulomonas endometrii TaxID=3036301 RepID=UPI0024AE77DD|nr:DUF1028 domain-containing protein [Cellulomonas endometrii]